MKDTRTSAAILIIGNEILSGRVQDVNVNYICKQMFGFGIMVCEVMIVPDEEQEIIFAVNHLRKKHNYVFTTGGIGPTHDDITSASIAKAFGRSLVLHNEALEIQNKAFEVKGIVTNENAKRMVMMPEGCNLIMTTKTATPSFFIENVFVMAGIPDVMVDMFEDVKKHIKKEKSFVSKHLTVREVEGIIADMLEEVDDAIEQISIGSYPYKAENEWRVDVVVTGIDEDLIDQALNMIKNNLLSQKIIFEEKQ